MKLISVWIVVALSLGACGKSSSSDKAPPAPPNGSPIAAEFVDFVDSKTGRAMKVKVYNLGDRTAIGYTVLAKYLDDKGAVLKTKQRAALEKENDFTTLQGMKYSVEPKKWATLEVPMMEIPAEAKKAEVLISAVRSVDGADVKEWWSQPKEFDWPQ